jgi:hypothetical protein
MALLKVLVLNSRYSYCHDLGVIIKGVRIAKRIY